MTFSMISLLPPTALGGLLLVLGLLWPTGEGRADSTRLEQRAVKIAERGTVTAYTTRVGNQTFRLLPPPDWLLSPEITDGVITLVTRDRAASLALKFIPRLPETNQARLRETWLAELARRFPDGKVEREFPCFVAGEPGIVFDVERTLATKRVVLSRVAFVPVRDQQIELAMLCGLDKLPARHFAFANLLSSLRVEAPAAPK